MAVCDVCKKTFRSNELDRRLAIPEYRAMTGFWPWMSIAVCRQCAAAHDQSFLERLRLLAPDVLENDEPIAEPLCLACATLESAGPWREASRWVDADGRPTRRARFHLCDRHAGMAYVEGIVVASNLTNETALGAVLDELPTVGGDLLDRVEHWRPEGGHGPAGAEDFAAGRARPQTLAAAAAFWSARPAGLEAKAAWLGPVRKDYRMRYRLDLVRDFADGRRETLSVVRLGPDRFAAYRTVAQAPGQVRRAVQRFS